MNKNTKAPPPPPPTPALAAFAISVPVPPGQHKQVHAAEARVAMQSVGVASTYGKTSDIISPNSSAMLSYANTVLRSSTLPQITKFYAPNEMAGLLHDLQSRLGV